MIAMTQRIYGAFVTNVRDRMADLDLSQKDLAVRLKVSPSYVSQILSGHRRPGLDSLDEFATALEIDPADLIRQPEKIPETLLQS
jgi:transcriptional regulator with XRE-family HTH domain